MKFLFATVIWGKDYVDQFLRWSLPTQLAPGNLGDFPWAEGSTYLIITTPEDRDRIARAPLIRRLARMMTVAYRDISGIPLHNKYIGVSLAQLEALKSAADFDAVFFVYPDFVCSAGSIQYSARRIVEGARAVMFPIPAVLESIFDDPAITRNRVVSRTVDGEIVTIPPRLLVQASMNHFHPMISGYFMDGIDWRNIGTAYMAWDVPDRGILFRCFHLHPFVIRVERETPYFLVEFNVSLDEEYIPRLFKSTDRIDFPEFSDDFAMCSIREADSPPQPVPGPPRVDFVVAWAEEYASLIHRDFVLQPFRWSAGLRDEPNAEQAWQDAIERSEVLTRTIRERLNIPDSVLRYEDHLAFTCRRNRRRRFSTWLKPVFHRFHDTPFDGKLVTLTRPILKSPAERKAGRRAAGVAAGTAGRGGLLARLGRRPKAPDASAPAYAVDPMLDERSIDPDTLLGTLMRFKRVTGLDKLRRYPALFNAWIRVKTALLKRSVDK